MDTDLNIVKSPEQMTDTELNEAITKLIGTTPQAEDKQNVFTFLTNVAMADDTTKLGYLKDEEVGNPQLPIRSEKNLALIAGDIMENDFIKDYFLKESEITTSTSLSRDGFLTKMAIIQKREIADTTKRKTVNKSWFRKKETEELS